LTVKPLAVPVIRLQCPIEGMVGGENRAFPGAKHGFYLNGVKAIEDGPSRFGADCGGVGDCIGKGFYSATPEYLTSQVNGKARKASKYSHHNDFDDFLPCLP
jgi:hypothetical protein